MALPEEILSSVLAFLDPQIDHSTVAALRLANKTLCRCVTPLLYRRVKAPLATPGNSIDESKVSAYKLIEELDGDPKLRSWVKELSTSPATQSMIRDEARKQDIGENAPLPFYDGVSKSSLPEPLKQDILRALSKRSEHGGVAYLLTICTEIECLHFRMGFEGFRGLPRKVFEYATRLHQEAALSSSGPSENTRMLHAVTSLSFGHQYNDSALSNVLDLLYLPQLTSLTVDGLGNNISHRDHSLPPPDNLIRIYNPLTIKLPSCMLSGPGLRRLLAACLKVESLTVAWRVGDWTRDLTNQEIGDAIRQCGTSIKHLVLDTADVYSERTRSEEGPSFGDLTDITAHTLAVHRSTLYLDYDRPMQHGFPTLRISVPALPRTLRKLYVLGVEPDEVERCRDTVASFHLPHLRDIVIIPWHHHVIEEWFGPVHHESVDYHKAPELGLKRLTD